MIKVTLSGGDLTPAQCC